MEPVPAGLLALGFAEDKVRVALKQVGLSLPLTGDANLAAEFLFQHAGQPDAWWQAEWERLFPPPPYCRRPPARSSAPSRGGSSWCLLGREGHPIAVEYAGPLLQSSK